jgi:amino acid transporter
VAKAAAALKRVVLGRPMSSGELGHTLLPKTIALPVFSSDPLSSNAYATQEALIVLSLAGAAGLSMILPVSVAVATLLFIVVTSYRQTVKAYPSGGGAYRVSHENLGMYPGLLAASALLIDYVLTVSVSITAGVEALVSASETLEAHKIGIAFAFIAFVTLMNLRGVKESGTLFAIPTYGFVLSIYLLIATGFVKCFGGDCPQAESADMINDLGHTASAVSLVLLVRAFAAGTTALTGVEAIADGVPAFRYPQSRNASTTLLIMAGLSTSMFLGISWLADHTNVVYSEHFEGQRSVVAQIAAAVFAGGPMFYVVQFMSAAILILAANTAYQDFPRLASILAKDRYMPRQFMNRGDRLVFSNGVIILAVLSGLLIYVFDANLTRLIQLYLVGVFISFTLSQTGMVVRGRRLKEPGWKRGALISAFGGTVTGIVLIVIAASKFKAGAWIVIAAIPFVMFAMRSVNRHYRDVADQLGAPQRKPVDRRPGNAHFVILVTRVDAATARAVGYARSTRSADISAVTFDPSNHGPWRRLAPDIPLETLKGSKRSALLQHLRSKRAGMSAEDFLTVMTPEVLRSRTLYEIIRHPGMHRLKAQLVREPDVQVLDVPVLREDIDPMVDQAHEPARNHVIVLISAVHNAMLQAIEYAETLRPTDIRAVSFGLDPEETERLGDRWLDAQVPHPLEIEESPFRDLGISLTRYLDRFDPDGVNRVVTIVIPEFIVKKKRHQILHGQTALIVKRRMLFEKGVVVVSVPYHL